MNSNLIDFDCVDEFLSAQEIQKIIEFLWDDSAADRAKVPKNPTVQLSQPLSQPLPQNSPEHLKNAATGTDIGQLMTAVPSDDFGFFTFEFS